MASLQFCNTALEAQNKKRATVTKEILVPKELILAAGGNVTTIPEMILSQRELQITRANVVELLRHLHTLDPKIRWTSEEVTRAFCRRAAVAEQLINCLTEVFFDVAIHRAKEVDAYLEQNGKPLGSLAGRPISVKDCFNIKGLDSTLGFVAWTKRPAPCDSLLIKILREAGAILYCKSNTPTAMMIAETVNNLWGRTLNPHNTAMTSGGSSGGEGALLALRGAPVGVGTDIGGSIRIPAGLCGLYSLKPSFGRFPTMGCKSGMTGQESVNSINGPMANDLASLSIFAKAVVDSQPWRWDPKCIPIPWRQVEPSSLPNTGLVFGIIFDDGCIHPTPPVTRALNECKRQLQAAGHTVIDWTVQDKQFEEGARILYDFFTMDGRHGIYEIMKAGHEHERWVPGLGPVMESKSVNESWARQAKRWEWASRICEKWESMTGPDGRVMDAVISPVTPHAGAEHDKFGRHVGYTGVWNIMDFPGVTIPVLQADKQLDSKDTSIPSRFHNTDDETIWQNYAADKVHGLPTSVQIIGRRLEEEKLLALAERVTQLLHQS